MSVIVFDNLQNEKVSWFGDFADSVRSEQGEAVRAIDLVGIQGPYPHLFFAPDLFKHAEATHDLAIFYVAHPSKGGKSPIAVWQALGYWLGVRSRYAAPELRHREDDRTDSILFCEGDRISNLVNAGSVVLIQPELRSDQNGWQARITDVVHSYLQNKNGELNPRRIKLNALAAKIGVSTDELQLSGFAQSQRACKLRFGALSFMVSAREMALISGYLSRMMDIVADCDRYLSSAGGYSAQCSSLNHDFQYQLARKFRDFRGYLSAVAELACVEDDDIVSAVLRSSPLFGNGRIAEFVSTYQKLDSGDLDFSVRMGLDLFTLLMAGLRCAAEKALAIANQVETKPKRSIVHSIARNSKVMCIDQIFPKA